MPRLSALFVILAIAIRLILIPNPGFEADMSFWKSWGLATYDLGIVEGMKVTNNNYPPPFAYTLGVMVFVYKLFADPHNFNEFWKNTNLLFLTISKMLPILADFGIAGIILYIGKYSKHLGFPLIHNSVFLILALAYLLNPIALIDGAWWGQVDSVGVFIFLVAVIFALRRQAFLAGIIFILAMMTKLQNMIYGPLFFLFIWQHIGITGFIHAVAGALTGFVGLNIEFILTRNMDRVLANLTENYDYFPWMSLMAYNLWWIVTGAKGMVTSDKLTMLGMVNAKTIGLLLFSGLYLFAVLRQLVLSVKLAKPASPAGGLDQSVLKIFLESLIVINASFFLFQTQSHDRYAFPLSVFLLLWGTFLYQNQESRIKNQGKNWAFPLFILLYACFSLFYFYNLHTALVVNYPQNGLPILSLMTQPFFTITTAFVLLGLFGVFLFYLIRSSRITFHLSLVTIVFIVSALVYLNSSLITHSPVSLTSFTPYISEQGYGIRQTNKSVQSSFDGPYKWTRLSIQYLYYRSGIGTHANSKHVFDINKKFKTFTTDYGIDTEAGTKASAIFEIYGDDQLLFRSEKMGRFDLPKHADVTVAGIKFLKLITTDAGDGNNDDHTDWLNPQLLP